MVAVKRTPFKAQLPLSLIEATNMYGTQLTVDYNSTPDWIVAGIPRQRLSAIESEAILVALVQHNLNEEPDQ